MDDLKSKDLKEIENLCGLLGFPSFKARDIFRFIHKALIDKIDAITTLSLKERQILEEKYYISSALPEKTSSGKMVRKIAFKLEDGLIVEAVEMQYSKGQRTVCVSTQAGCPISCLFCATGKMRFRRNLTAGEILSQIYYFAHKGKISNIVFMGMGEPFLNYDNVIKSAKILNHSLGQNIAARKIVISTIGLISGIRKLAKEESQFRLAWSLISPFDKERKRLVPLKSLTSIDKTILALQEYQQATKRRITIEYVVLKEVNDRKRDARELIEIAKKLDSHVNLIPFNPSPALSFKPGNIFVLFRALQQEGVNVTIRKSLGRDIQAACGQLANQ